MSMRVITDWLKEKGYAGVGKVYPILGNHEGLPCDAFDVHNKTHQWILDNLTEIWGTWFTKECKLCGGE